jgi:hypothetical protein
VGRSAVAADPHVTGNVKRSVGDDPASDDIETPLVGIA